MDKKQKKMAVFKIIRQRDEAISLSELLERLGAQFAERSLRRWLNEMIDEGLLEKKGSKRGTRYQARASVPKMSFDFSSRSLEAIEYIRRPIFQRDPVSYQKKWLEEYQPNKTYYLENRERQKLLARGARQKNHDPAGTYAKKIYNRLLIDLSYNSSRLEGNTYSILETEKLILEGAGALEKLDEERVMILNHKEAIRHLVEKAPRIHIDFNEICTLHYLLSDGLVPAQYSGKIRDYGVRIGGSTYVPFENPVQIEKQLKEICQKAAEIENPFEQSFFLLAHVAYLQAFVDVNKRTSRLSANIPLIRENLVPLSFNDVEKDDYTSAMIAIYEKNNVAPLAELYEFSYLRTCAQYDATAESLGFNEIRVRYRDQRREMIRYIILGKLHDALLMKYILARIKENIPAEDREKFKKSILEDLKEIGPQKIAGLGVSVEELREWMQNSSNF
jgi:Fic family protein